MYNYCSCVSNRLTIVCSRSRSSSFVSSSKTTTPSISVVLFSLLLFLSAAIVGSMCNENVLDNDTIDTNYLLVTNDDDHNNNNYYKEEGNGSFLVVTDVLLDGESETRIRSADRKLYAKETAFGVLGISLKLRELTDGVRFIQLIYDDSGLRDCEFGRDRHEIHQFIDKFNSDIFFSLKPSETENNESSPESKNGNLRRTVVSTILTTEDQSESEQRWWWTDYADLRDHCRKRHRQLKRQMKSELQHSNGSLSHRHRRQEDQSRCKRDLSDLLRVPGTKWCGKGYSATKYTQLGGISRTDKCCRTHDTKCPFWIGGFDTKYGLFNWRVNTLMHCACDERFRACLKMAQSGEANFVGKVFFNVVQTKCFVLKPKKICRKRTWWGKCMKKKIIKRAILRNNIKYK